MRLCFSFILLFILVCLSSKAATKSGPSNYDFVHNLLPGHEIEINIHKLNKDKLLSASLDDIPWSDDYWPIYKGGVAARYANNDFSMLSTWMESFDYIQNRPITSDFILNNQDYLSPAEKYDLLIGNNFALTKQQWSEGKSYFQRSGEVEKWMGICHGWAPASYMEKEPRKVLHVPSFDGKHLIKFYPSDLKALISLMWAKNNYKVHFMGKRCNSTSPDVDELNRDLDIRCLDSNPASFHLALVNSLGIYKKSFVMDVSFDYEVWNQPVYSYRIKYFDVNSGEETTLDQGIKELSLIEDSYRKYRHPKAKYIVGVNIEVDYSVEIVPSQRDVYIFENEINTAYYYYDLELDKNFNIIGGEWHQRDHPDFLWTPAVNSKPLTSSDYYLLSEKKWNLKRPLSQRIKQHALREAKSGKPLYYIINSLNELSK